MLEVSADHRSKLKYDHATAYLPHIDDDDVLIEFTRCGDGIRFMARFRISCFVLYSCGIGKVSNSNS